MLADLADMGVAAGPDRVGRLLWRTRAHTRRGVPTVRQADVTLSGRRDMPECESEPGGTRRGTRVEPGGAQVELISEQSEEERARVLEVDRRR